MRIEEMHFTLKDGRAAALRSPSEEDAERMLDYVVNASGETPFLLRYPEEWADYTIEREKSRLKSALEADDRAMLTCFVGERVAGSCSIALNGDMKTRHRASVAIAIRREYWGNGIGTRMLVELERVAVTRGVTQLELDFIEGNTRAQRLYEKAGYHITGVRPDAIRFRDGSMANEIMMVKRIEEMRER